VVLLLQNDKLIMSAMPRSLGLGHESCVHVRTTDVDIIEEMLWTMAEDMAKKVPPLVARQLYRLAAKMEDEIQAP
jgi:hypothetical protein